MLQNISRQKDVKGREAAVSDEEIEMGDEMERTTERKVESARQTINSSTFAKTFTAPKYVVSLPSQPRPQVDCRANSAWGSGDEVPCAPRNRLTARSWRDLG